MGVDQVAGSASAQEPSAPPPDPAAARARRSLAASRAARNGISTMVDALRISKPPRAPPPKPSPHNSAPPALPPARRHALIPLAEGRPELEARIRALENVVATRDEALLRLKRQWARALIRRRHHDRTREALVTRLSNTIAAARTSHAAATTARADLATLADDVSAAGDGPDFRENIATAVELARAKLSVPLPELDPAVTAPIAIAPPPTQPHATSASRATSDDDARSCGSLASSALGEDRDAQLDSLAELVALLDAKLAAGPPHPTANTALARARRTLHTARPEMNGNGTNHAAESSSERAAVRAVVLDVLGTLSNAPDEQLVTQAAEKEVALRAATTRLDEMTQRVATLEKIAERAVRADDLADRCTTLEAELCTAKKTIARLVQQNRSPALRMRAGTASAAGTPANATPPVQSPNIVPKPASTVKGNAVERENSDAIRRILDWRQSASSENHPPPIAPISASAATALRGSRKFQHKSRSAIGRNTTNRDLLPDRPVPTAAGEATTDIASAAPVMARRGENTGFKRQTPASEDAGDRELAFSDRSIEGPTDAGSASAQSVPVQGFLRRHDSFLSAGGVSASGDEITLMRHRKIFANVTQPVDGLRGLLG